MHSTRSFSLQTSNPHGKKVGKTEPAKPQGKPTQTAQNLGIFLTAADRHTSSFPGPPAEYLHSDGGFESNWGSDTHTKSLIDANLGTWILVMEPATLRPPHFVDAPMLMAVLEGKGFVLYCDSAL
jgi:hypothetical protein